MSNPGKIVLDIPPSKGNPRNSEGAFHTLENGRILFIYSKFIGETPMDDATACIAARHSDDGGESWSDAQTLFTPKDHDAKNIMGVSLLPMANGDIGLFYAVRKGWHDTRLCLRRSADGGESWGEATYCVPAPGYYVTNNDRVIRLSTGRILVPANYHRMKNFDQSDWNCFDLRGIPVTFYSDDDGITWKEGSSYCFATLPHCKTGLQESGMLELRSGAIWQWMRTDTGRQYEAFSTDGGDSWTPPVPSRFTAPDSPLCIKRIPDDGRLFAVWNPIPNYIGRNNPGPAGWGRTPLVAATSADEGKSWSEPLVLENDPMHGYCYTAIHFTKDSVLLAYCAGGPEDGICLAKTRIRKLPRPDAR